MGWYEDWQRQNLAFTPRMDQGGGEYTGYIKDVYEGDDAMPGQEFFPGPSTAQQGRMGMLTPLEIAQQRKAKGNFTSAPGAASLLAASDYQRLGGGPNVGSLDYQQNLRERALDGEVAPEVNAGAIASGVASPNVTDTGAPWIQTAKNIGGLATEILTPNSEEQNTYAANAMSLLEQAGKTVPQGVWNTVFKGVDIGKGWVDDAARSPYYGDLIDKGVASLNKWLSGGTPSVSTTPTVTTPAPTIANALGSDPYDVAGSLTSTAVPTRIFPTGATEAPVTVDPAREASDRNLQDLIAAQDRGEITPEVDADTSQSLSEMLGAGPAAAAFAANTTAAVGGAELLRREGVKTWRNSTKGQLSQLRKDLAANTKAMATEDPAKFRSHTRDKDARLKAKIAELESKETRRQQARAFINKQLASAKGGVKKASSKALSGLKRGALGAIPTAVGGGVAYASWKYGMSKANAATADGVLGDVSGLSEEERIAALYEASAVGDLDGTPYADFASRMEQFDSAGSTAGGVAELLDPMGGTSGRTTNQMGPLVSGQYQWNTPSIDPNWRY